MEDLISRRAVIDLFAERLNGWTLEEAIPIVDRLLNEREQCDDVWHAVVTIRDVAECVKQEVEKYLPSAKRNTGAWVGIDDFPHEEWECNQCGKIVYTDGETGIEEYEFCPHCGAEMLNAEGDGGAEWVETSGGEHYKCSRCGYLAPYYLSTDREPCEWLSDFCPNCGKLMWRYSDE